MPQIEGVAVVCWLMGGATGEPEAVAALHGPRLEALLERLVDTPVRGFVYEAVGAVQARRLEEGEQTALHAGRRYRLPVELLRADPSDHAGWVGAAAGAVAAVLGPR
jgi:hypothetical protein